MKPVIAELTDAKRVMTKIEAIKEILIQDYKGKASRAALKRLRQAERALGLNDSESRWLEMEFSYRETTDSDVYERFI